MRCRGANRFSSTCAASTATSSSSNNANSGTCFRSSGLHCIWSPRLTSARFTQPAPPHNQPRLFFHLFRHLEQRPHAVPIPPRPRRLERLLNQRYRKLRPRQPVREINEQLAPFDPHLLRLAFDLPDLLPRLFAWIARQKRHQQLCRIDPASPRKRVLRNRCSQLTARPYHHVRP